MFLLLLILLIEMIVFYTSDSDNKVVLFIITLMAIFVPSIYTIVFLILLYGYHIGKK